MTLSGRMRQVMDTYLMRLACLPDSRAAANRVKRVLHAVFELDHSAY